MRLKINHLLIATFFACLFLFISYLSSAGQTVPFVMHLPIVVNDLRSWIGPNGGYITAVVIDPFNPMVVYAGSWGSGMFKSQDNGQTWIPANQGLGNFYINSLAIDPTKPTTLYAGTYKNQLYKSVDGGNTWTWSGAGMQDQAIVYAIAIDPTLPARLYAATRGISNNGNPPWKGVVYKSVDAGQTWTPSLTNVGGVDAQDWIYSLAVDPNYHNNIYAASHEHGPFYSYDAGTKWNVIDSGIKDYSGRAIVIDPRKMDSSTLYYGVWHTDAVYKSITRGEDWFLSNNKIVNTRVYSMAIDPLYPDQVYLATHTSGILKTLDGGSNWQSGGLQDDKIYSIAIDRTTSSTVYAGTAGDGLQKSLDAGTSWQPANTGIDNAMATSVIVSDTKKLFASIFGAGVVQSSDRGMTWSYMNKGLGDKYVHALVQDPANPSLIFALTNTGGLFQNNINRDTGWVAVGQDLPLTEINQSAYPADHPFATHDMQEFSNSPDNDISGNQINSVNLLVMTFAPSNPQIVYMGTAGSGVYKSTDGGHSWVPAGLGGETIQSLAVDQLDSNIVYAATLTPGNLKISLNGGSSWSDASLPVTFYSLATAPYPDGCLYAGTSEGFYRYQSGSWNQMGLADQVITAIAINLDDQNRIYAGTDSNGAYYTIDGGLSWQIVDGNLTGLTIQSINLDPSSPNIVYFSTKTHGIYLAEIGF
jgi:photosystem II stability/assembly factor-like uncharacterized protein